MKYRERYWWITNPPEWAFLACVGALVYMVIRTVFP